MDLNNNRTKPSANQATATASATSRQQAPNFKPTTSKGSTPSFTTSKLGVNKSTTGSASNFTGTSKPLKVYNPPKYNSCKYEARDSANKTVQTASKLQTPQTQSKYLSSSKNKIEQPINIGPPPKLPPKNPKYAHVTSKFMLPPPPPPIIELPKPKTVAPSKYNTTNRSIKNPPLDDSTVKSVKNQNISKLQTPVASTKKKMKGSNSKSKSKTPVPTSKTKTPEPQSESQTFVSSTKKKIKGSNSKSKKPVSTSKKKTPEPQSESQTFVSSTKKKIKGSNSNKMPVSTSKTKSPEPQSENQTFVSSTKKKIKGSNSKSKTPVSTSKKKTPEPQSESQTFASASLSKKKIVQPINIGPPPSKYQSSQTSSKFNGVHPMSIGPPPNLPPKNPKYAHVTSKYMLPPPPPIIELTKPKTVTPSSNSKSKTPVSTSKKKTPKPPSESQTFVSSSKRKPARTAEFIDGRYSGIYIESSTESETFVPSVKKKIKNAKSKKKTPESSSDSDTFVYSFKKKTKKAKSKSKTPVSTSKNKTVQTASKNQTPQPPSKYQSSQTSSKFNGVHPMSIGPPPNLPPKNPKYAHITSKYMLPPPAHKIELQKPKTVTPSKYNTTNRSIPKPPLGDKPVKPLWKPRPRDPDNIPWCDPDKKPTDITKGFKLPRGYHEYYKKLAQSKTTKGNNSTDSKQPGEMLHTYNPPTYNSLKYQPPESCKPKPKLDGPPTPKPPKHIPHRYSRDPNVPVRNYKNKIIKNPEEREEEDYLEMFCDGFRRRREKYEQLYEKKRYKYTINRRGLPHQLLPYRKLLPRNIDHPEDFQDVFHFMY